MQLIKKDALNMDSNKMCWFKDKACTRTARQTIIKT